MLVFCLSHAKKQSESLREKRGKEEGNKSKLVKDMIARETQEKARAAGGGEGAGGWEGERKQNW